MEHLEIPVGSQLKTRLEAIAKWYNTSPDVLAREILKMNVQEVWKHQGHDIEEMLHGLEYYNSHLKR